MLSRRRMASILPFALAVDTKLIHEACTCCDLEERISTWSPLCSLWLNGTSLWLTFAPMQCEPKNAFLLSELLEKENIVTNDAVADDAEEKTKTQRNTLIVAPASLVYNWNSEIQKSTAYFSQSGKNSSFSSYGISGRMSPSMPISLHVLINFSAP